MLNTKKIATPNKLQGKSSKGSKKDGDSYIIELYFKEARKYPLLTKEEEIILGAEIWKLNAEIKDIKNKLKSCPESQKPELQESLAKVEKQKKLTEDKFANANLRLVISIAKSYINRGLDIVDLIGEGNIGLIEAVENLTTARIVDFQLMPLGGSGKQFLRLWLIKRGQYACLFIKPMNLRN